MFKNEWDSIVVLNATDLTFRLIMPNTTFVSEISRILCSFEMLYLTRSFQFFVFVCSRDD